MGGLVGFLVGGQRLGEVSDIAKERLAALASLVLRVGRQGGLDVETAASPGHLPAGGASLGPAHDLSVFRGWEWEEDDVLC